MEFKAVNFDYTLMKEDFHSDKDFSIPGFYGSIFVGELCFDIIIRDDDDKRSIEMLPYIGGIDDGFGYSTREAMATGKYKDDNDVPDDECYPYTDYPEDSIHLYQMFDTEREQVETMEQAIVKFIGEHAADLEKYAAMETHVW